MTEPTITEIHDDRRQQGASARRRLVGAIVIALTLCTATACGSSSSDSSPSPSASDSNGDSKGSEKFPDVLKVELKSAGEGKYVVATTLSSPYDSPERYADAWRVTDPDGKELGVRELGHDHASEQPFTRNETIAIPDDVDKITVEGRDQVSGYGGKTVTVSVPRR